MKKINFESVKKFITVCYMVYLVAYVAASVVTLLVLYKDQIVSIIRKVGAMLRRMMIKVTCFFKGVQDKRHVKEETNTEWLKEAMRDAPVVHLSDLERFDNDPKCGVEFAYSEE